MSAFSNGNSNRLSITGETLDASSGVPRTALGSRHPSLLLQRLRSLLLIASGVTLVGTASLSSAQGLAVGEGGTPSYGIAIAVPPGIAGMQPNIGLAYTGGGVNGPVGFGWTLEGLSSITRCGYTAAIDGYAHGVDYGPNDKLCLDGQRLIQTDANGVPVNGTVTSPSPTNPFQQNDSLGFTDSSVREYRTEKDTFSRIRAYGATAGAPANGPAYFKVWTKAGQIYEFGPKSNNTSNSAILASGKNVAVGWAVSRISDTLGNYIDFQYTQRDLRIGSGPASGITSGHEWNLAEIRYTGHGTQVPTNKVVFSYSDRPATPVQDLSEAYHKGSKTVSVARLSGVRTYVGWPADAASQPSTAVKVKTLKLVYDSGAIAQRSRVHQIIECVGAAEATCMPPSTFNYAAGGTDEYRANAGFSASSLSTTVLQNNTGTLGVILGDFNGDGLTDVLRWSDTPAQNQLWTSKGDGTFKQETGFNITADNLFKSDGCYATYPIDVNGDGLTDLLRVRQNVSSTNATCPAGSNYLYLSKGDGTFTVTTIPASIVLNQVTSTQSSTTHCGAPALRPVAGAANAKAAAPAATAPCNGPSQTSYSQTQGSNFHLIDVNGDGKIDIVTTILPAYSDEYPKPLPDAGCSVGSPCTHVYLQNSAGAFVEYTGTNIASHTVYGPPGPSARAPNARLRPYIFDVDGDGISDLVVDSGTWRSNGDGNFTYFSPTAGGCDKPLDFNGDGRADCLYAFAGSAPFIKIADGVGDASAAAAFNLTAVGQELQGTGIGVMLLDINGDGRTDVLRWEDTPANNALYLSNGDGSFTPSTTFKFNSSNTPIQLKKSDGTADLLAGDFTGHGHTEFLRLLSTITTGEAGTNQLYTKVDQTPVDQIQSSTSGTGLTTNLAWVSLANSTSGALGARYASDRGTPNAAVAPAFDLSFPAYVVATSTSDSGVGTARVSTEYFYAGLKASNDGRGLKGFREVRRQNQGADGTDLTVVTQYLQTYPYTGVASKTETWRGDLNQTSPTVISRTTNVYCDWTAANGANVAATSTAPCPTTAKVQVPYVYSTLEQGWELGSGITLPSISTVNVFNSHGDPTSIAVTTTGTALGIAQTFTKTSTNTYFPDATSNDTWILGRLQTSTQTNTVPNSLASIATSAGTSKFASATTGALVDASLSAPVFTNTTVGQSMTAAATLTNTGGAAINLTVPTTTSVTGTDFALASTTCGATLAVGANCTITVRFSPTAVASRTGQLIVQTELGPRTVGLAANGVALPVLSLIACTPDLPNTTPVASVLRCGLLNSGLVAATSITYSSTVAGTTFTGPTTCGANVNCGAITMSSPTAAGTYSGTVRATPNAGTAGTATFTLVVNTKATLALSACVSVASTAPTAATFACTVSNTGQTAVTSIGYTSTISGATFSGPTGTCAVNAACGTVTMSTPTAAGVYNGTLTATPAGGIAGSSAFALTVRTNAILALSACTSSNSTAPSAATYTCTVSNSGQTAASSVAYTSTVSGATVSGPTGACAAGGTCGTVTLTSPTTAGTYSGSIVATPSNGTAASSGFNLAVLTPPAISVSSCVSHSTMTPTAATFMCSVVNSGQTTAQSVSYAANIGGVTVSGPTGACPTGTCGSVTVTTPTTVGSYVGTLSATPSSGTGGSTLFALDVTALPALSLGSCAAVNNTAPTASTYTCYLGNPSAADVPAVSFTTTVAGATVSGATGICPAHSSCGQVVLTTPTTAGSYAGTMTATPSLGSAASVAVSVNVLTPAAVALSNCASVTNTQTPTPATISCTVSNTGQSAIPSIAYVSTFNNLTVAGPTGACAAMSTCGTVTGTSGTVASTYEGNLTATPSIGAAATAAYSLRVLSQPSLALDNCVSVSPVTPNPATFTCTLSNNGGSGVSSVSYTSGTSSSVTITGPTGACAANSTCGTVQVVSATAPGDYGGTLGATPNVGGAASSVYLLSVYPPPFLAFGCNTTTNTLTPTPAALHCSVHNASWVDIASISYASTLPGVTISGPTGACAKQQDCGTATMTTSGAPGNYAGTISATPANGTTSSVAFSLDVLTPPALVFSACSANTNTTAPTAASFTCTLSNTGTQQTWSGMTFSSNAPGVTITSTTAFYCFGASTCGTVTVTTPASAGTWAGTLTAAVGGGSSANAGFSLTVLTAPALVLSNCNSVSTTAPTAATMTCTVSNSGQLATSSISYGSSLGGMSIAGPTGSCGALAVCGSVTISSPSSGGSYAGTLTATPVGGAAGSAGFNLTVTAAATLFTSVGSPSLGGGGTFGTWTFQNTGPAAVITGMDVNYSGRGGSAYVSGGTCSTGATLASGATCTVSVSAEKNCGTGNVAYSVWPWLGNAAGQGNASGVLNVPGIRPPCP